MTALANVPGLTLGDLMRRARATARMKQSEVAARLHVSAATVSNWETDRAMPGIDQLVGFAQVTGALWLLTPDVLTVVVSGPPEKGSGPHFRVHEGNPKARKSWRRPLMASARA